MKRVGIIYILFCIALNACTGVAKADVLDIEGNVKAYLDANPTIADSMQPKAEVKYLGFSTKFDRNAQLGLTALMILDTAQTVTIARNADCLKEGNPIAAAIYGSDAPSQERVLITNAIYITGHWLLSRYLDSKSGDGWKLAKRTYQVLTFLGHGSAVANNASLGIKPFSNHNCGL